MVAPYSVLVTGASRGIGLQLCKEFLNNKNIEHVIAGCRHPDGATELNNIEDGRLTIVKMDVTKDDQIQRAYEIVENLVGERGLTMLVNNAGIFVDYYTDQEPNRDLIKKQFDTNVVSVSVISQKFLPLLKRASARVAGNELSPSRACIINLSSNLASMGDQTSGSHPKGTFAYRMSKAAVNSMTKTMSFDLTPYHILVVGFCPGSVHTDFGGPSATQTVEECVGKMVPTIYKLNGHFNGSYLQHTGETLNY